MNDIDRAIEYLKNLNESLAEAFGDNFPDGENPLITAITALQAQQDKLQHTNLCDTCQWGCMAECPKNPDIAWGCGVGNDNVVGCHNYINVEAYAKYQQPKTKFEAWKAGLTLEKFISKYYGQCKLCPASGFCDELDDNHEALCDDVLRQWGEQNAE